MKCPKEVAKVEVWSHTIFFMNRRMDATYSISRDRGGRGDRIFAAVDRITALMGISKYNNTCWWEMTPEEFESVTEGVNYETPGGEELGDDVLDPEDIYGR